MTDTLTRMNPSGLEFSTSICDLMELPASLMFCSDEVVACFGGLATSGKDLCLFGMQSLDTDDLRLPRCQRLVHYLAGKLVWLHRKGKFGDGTCMKWALGNHGNSAVVGLPHVANSYRS